MANTAKKELEESYVTLDDLPITFQVKYLGTEISNGLWGIKFTRRPVETLVKAAKSSTLKTPLPLCNLTVSLEGVKVVITSPETDKRSWTYPIHTISYAVQDLIYTRVFAMIVVKDVGQLNPCDMHAFVCDSRSTARRITFALSAAFKDFSRRVKQFDEQSTKHRITEYRQKFAIDLRTPEEQQADASEETEA
ncbi:uncharacterized protein LOC101450478 isoform X2 [Ceratitis capitata]|nr:uncharacterized protein LOC101450478 isoform X2 [Ceratitis capitata]XP_020714176.1 uncharacterized protein LOC101450478 isoform X2 [Ceratitis capitata]XP_020714177.1 uncharacterized protein LOC101450478 isoform X2 [Ceratitis capitata]XP_020714178.1 uncharacterized protein LOC101450478 isoform X2 [Ceratitis capitata]XP_020714179.1 uncharacterized protein LOC101450478 isoform X2 [Ceratitis capitata]